MSDDWSELKRGSAFDNDDVLETRTSSIWEDPLVTIPSQPPQDDTYTEDSQMLDPLPATHHQQPTMNEPASQYGYVPFQPHAASQGTGGFHYDPYGRSEPYSGNGHPHQAQGYTHTYMNIYPPEAAALPPTASSSHTEQGTEPGQVDGYSMYPSPTPHFAQLPPSQAGENYDGTHSSYSPEGVSHHLQHRVDYFYLHTHRHARYQGIDSDQKLPSRQLDSPPTFPLQESTSFRSMPFASLKKEEESDESFDDAEIGQGSRRRHHVSNMAAPAAAAASLDRPFASINVKEDGEGRYSTPYAGQGRRLRSASMVTAAIKQDPQPQMATTPPTRPQRGASAPAEASPSSSSSSSRTKSQGNGRGRKPSAKKRASANVKPRRSPRTASAPTRMAAPPVPPPPQPPPPSFVAPAMIAAARTGIPPSYSHTAAKLQYPNRGSGAMSGSNIDFAGTINDSRDQELNNAIAALNVGHLRPTAQELKEAKTDRAKGALLSWYQRLKELYLFRHQHGHVNVPQKYENKQLGVWVNKMRMEMKNYMEGQPSKMTQRKIDLLEQAGFVWAKRKGQTAWENRFRELVQYKEEHGDCNVPTKYKTNKALGRWVSTQRSMYKKFHELEESRRRTGATTTSTTSASSDELTIEREEAMRRIHALEQHGFVWRMVEPANASSSPSTSEPDASRRSV